MNRTIQGRLLLALSVLAPTAAAAQGDGTRMAAKPDAEVMNYRLSMD